MQDSLQEFMQANQQSNLLDCCLDDRNVVFQVRVRLTTGIFALAKLDASRVEENQRLRLSTDVTGRFRVLLECQISLDSL